MEETSIERGTVCISALPLLVSGRESDMKYIYLFSGTFIISPILGFHCLVVCCFGFYWSMVFWSLQRGIDLSPWGTPLHRQDGD